MLTSWEHAYPCIYKKWLIMNGFKWESGKFILALYSQIIWGIFQCLRISLWDICGGKTISPNKQTNKQQCLRPWWEFLLLLFWKCSLCGLGGKTFRVDFHHGKWQLFLEKPLHYLPLPLLWPSLLQPFLKFCLTLSHCPPVCVHTFSKPGVRS